MKVQSLPHETNRLKWRYSIDRYAGVSYASQEGALPSISSMIYRICAVNLKVRYLALTGGKVGQYHYGVSNDMHP
jgi:hypothetical protein